MHIPQQLAPEYAQCIARGQKSAILKFITDDNSGVVCFDQFTQDTWIQLPETATLPTSSVED